MNKLVKIIETMGMKDLMKIKRDLDEGNIKKLIEKRIETLSDNKKICPVCHKKITDDGYTLVFGNQGIKMQASFDAMDCLEHFVNRMKKQSS